MKPTINLTIKGKQFNPANGEPHTAKFLAKERAEGRRRKR